jgi:hypothetical protein
MIHGLNKATNSGRTPESTGQAIMESGGPPRGASFALLQKNLRE